MINELFYSLFSVGEKSGDFRIEFFGRAKNRAILAIFWAILTKSIWSHCSLDFILRGDIKNYCYEEAKKLQLATSERTHEVTSIPHLTS